MLPRFRIQALVLGDILVLASSYLTVSWVLTRYDLMPEPDWMFFLESGGGLSIGFVLATLLFGLHFVGLYEQLYLRSRLVLIQNLFIVFGVALIMQSVVSYAKTVLVLPRWLMLYGSAMAGVLLVIWRVGYSTLLRHIAPRQGILLFGSSPVVTRLAEYINEHPERGYRILGCVEETRDLAPPGVEWIPADHELPDLLGRFAPDRIVMSPHVMPEGQLGHQLLACSRDGLLVESLDTLYEEIFHRVSLETLSLEKLVFSSAFRPSPFFVLLQNIYGRLIAALGLVLTLPVMLGTAVAVRLDSPGPILLRQRRIGCGGRVFALLKFRSMYVNADRHGAPQRAKERDPRVTRVGRFIRLSRIDELPQFINVLRGEMSIVGPRPEMPEFEKDLVTQIPFYQQRLRVKPGITGWAQIHHTPEDSLDSTKRKLEYDLYYIKNFSPGLDFYTMFSTARTILLRIGAR